MYCGVVFMRRIAAFLGGGLQANRKRRAAERPAGIEPAWRRSGQEGERDKVVLGVCVVSTYRVAWVG